MLRPYSPYFFPQTARGVVILSERAERARAKDLLVDDCGTKGVPRPARAKELLLGRAPVRKEILRACGAVLAPCPPLPSGEGELSPSDRGARPRDPRHGDRSRPTCSLG